jgi:hypothetical protein
MCGGNQSTAGNMAGNYPPLSNGVQCIRAFSAVYVR